MGMYVGALKTAAFTAVIGIGLGVVPPVGALAATGKTHSFTVTSANAIGRIPVSEREIARRAARICPNGYREVSRLRQEDVRGSGIRYVDVTVRIVCR